ncbi:MAG: hypothetical protein BAJALOKI2v1_90076 [Promethearchaeota archaeon]|nr:MAG: hypothetical protein BAJALOKI2v1_90076 [Candidatus Lokiarchaeota archaeon]
MTSEEIESQGDTFSATRKVLEMIELQPDEIETYFSITGRGPVVIGEISLLAKVSKERAEEIAKNLLEKGLVREIPGKTPHYMALPPYVALLQQIHRFKNLVQSIKENTPATLEERFKRVEDQSAKLQQLEDYREYIQDMKTSLPAQIKGQFSKFEKELEAVKKFKDVKEYIHNLKEVVPENIMEEFQNMESHLEKIKTEISDKFEKQFRVGALKTMAEKIVSKVVSEQFEIISDKFQQRFVRTTQDMLNKVVQQISSVSDAAGEISTDLGEVFDDIESGLKGTLEDLDYRISSVHSEILSSLNELKQLFQKEIFDTLQKDVIASILKQLEISEATMEEFWERSKKASLLTFKDVWFVRSPEGMVAQLNDAISRVKMRLYIIIPKLQDIDIVALQEVKRHINIRISTNFDINNEEDKAILEEVEEHPNITVRHYPRENLWAINKDFEEVVVSVVSRTEEGIEIAGMGSILEEHVKLFAGLLEDVWIQSKKMDYIETTGKIAAPRPKKATSVGGGEQSVKPSEILSQQQKAPTEQTPAPKQQPSHMKAEPNKPGVLETKKEQKSDIAKPEKKIEPKPQKPIKEQIEPQKEITETIPSRKTPEPIEAKSTVEVSKEPIETSKEMTLSQEFDEISKNLSEMSGNELSTALSDLQNNVLEKKGYSSVLRQIDFSSSSYKGKMEKLPGSEVQEMHNKLNFWKQKLGL